MEVSMNVGVLVFLKKNKNNKKNPAIAKIHYSIPTNAFCFIISLMHEF